MTDRGARIACAAFGLFITIKLGFMAFYSQHMQWVMDEFAQGHGGQLVEMGLYSNVDPIKTALPYFAYDAALHLGSDSEEVLRLWRLETFVVAVLIVLVTASVARRLYRSALLAGLSAVTLLSFSNFVERAFRVRNDNFATLFAMCSLYVMLRWRRSPRGAYGAGLLAGLAFLCTQKSVYFVVALGTTLVVLGLRRRRFWVDSLRFGAGIALALIGYGLLLGGLDAPSVLAAVFVSPLAKSHHLLVDSPWADLGRFVAQTLERNAFAYALSVAGLAAILVGMRRRPTAWVAVALGACVITLLVFRHPQPWPYVFVMCMPFLALLVPALLPRIRARARGAVLTMALLLLCVSFERNVSVLAQDDELQLRTVREAEAMLQPDDRYFDGVAMIAKRPIAGEHPWWWWDAPTLIDLRGQIRRGETRHAASILQQRPKLWIWNYRLPALPELTDPVRRFSTVRVSEVILVSGRAIRPGSPSVFRNLWSGPYHLLRGDGQPAGVPLMVNGAPCGEPCVLEPGTYELSSVADTPTFLLPADVVPDRPLPVTGTPPALFQGVYDF